MTMERDHSRHIGSVDHSSAHDETSRQESARRNIDSHRYATVDESMALLETIMEERAEVFRKLAR